MLSYDIVDVEYIYRAIITIDQNTLDNKVWQEVDYRLDICGVPKGSHIEHL